MDELLKMCLIVCPLIFLGGFVDSVAGGGGLITLPAYMMAGVPVHFAAGTNKVVNGIGTAAATAKYFRSGKIRLSVALPAAAGALAGGYLGAEIAKLLSDSLLQGLMLVALPVVAVFLVLKKDFGQETGEMTRGRTYELLVSLGIGLAIGCYDGMIGPGTGTFMIMAFTALLSLDMVVPKWGIWPAMWPLRCRSSLAVASCGSWCCPPPSAVWRETTAAPCTP